MVEERKVDIKEVEEKMSKVLDMNVVEDFLQNNEYVFEFGGKTYKVVKTTFKGKQEVYKKLNAKKISLLQEKDANGNFVNKTEKELIELYEKRGISILELNQKFATLSDRQDKLTLKLGEAIKEKKPESEWKAYKEEINNLEKQKRLISIEKTSYLENSVETQCMVFSYCYLAYLVSYVKEGDKWIKPWSSYEEFTENGEDLINVLVMYSSLMSKEDVKV